MAEVLGVTASVVAIATLAWDSSKTLYRLVDGLHNAPEAIAHKNNLSLTQSALQTLKLDLKTQNSSDLDLLLQKVRLADALKSSQKLCDRFGKKIDTYTKHSKDATFSKRDRFIVNLHETEIYRFTSDLQDHW